MNTIVFFILLIFPYLSYEYSIIHQDRSGVYNLEPIFSNTIYTLNVSTGHRFDIRVAKGEYYWWSTSSLRFIAFFNNMYAGNADDRTYKPLPGDQNNGFIVEYGAIYIYDLQPAIRFYFLCNTTAGRGRPVERKNETVYGMYVFEWQSAYACRTVQRYRDANGIFDISKLAPLPDIPVTIPNNLVPTSAIMNLGLSLSEQYSYCDPQRLGVMGCIRFPEPSYQYTYSIGLTNTFRLMSIPDKTGLRMLYSGGMNQYNESQNTQIDIVCSSKNSNLTFVQYDTRALTWKFAMESRYGCPNKCSFQDSVAFYDFSKLADMNKDYAVVVKGAVATATVYMNMCSRLVSNAHCREYGESSACIMLPNPQQNLMYSISRFGTIWFSERSVPGEGAIAHLTGGDRGLGMEIELICDQTVDIGYPIYDNDRSNATTFMFVWRTQYACATPNYGSTSSSKSTSSSSSSSYSVSSMSDSPSSSSSATTVSSSPNSNSYSTSPSSSSDSIPSSSSSSSSLSSATDSQSLGSAVYSSAPPTTIASSSTDSYPGSSSSDSVSASTSAINTEQSSNSIVQSSDSSQYPLDSSSSSISSPNNETEADIINNRQNSVSSHNASLSYSPIYCLVLLISVLLTCY